jgi:HK97 family phage major capsid protein
MPRLVEVREKLDSRQALVGKVLEEAGEDLDFANVKCLGENLDTQAKVDTFRALNDELADLQRDVLAIKALEDGRKTFEGVEGIKADPVGLPPQPSARGGEKSIGQRLVESDEYREFMDDHTKGFAMSFPDVELKTLMSTTAGWAPESGRIGRVVDAVTRPIQVLDLIPFGQTDANSIVYMEETLRTHSAAEKLEGVTYAESAFELTERSVQVRKITDSIPVTDEQLEDEAQVRSYLDQRLRFGLRQRLDTQTLGGDGVPPNLEGILNVAGIQTQAKGADPRFDASHKAMTLVRVTGRAFPDSVVLHPNDWEAIRLTRTADGIYILGNPAVAGPMTLFGLPVAIGDVITENTGLVGDFGNFCQLFERRGVDVQVGFTGTQFVEGKQTMRADLRAAFVVFRPAAFCTVTGL